jgi:hypothetical protein
MKHRISIECPYCKFNNKTILDDSSLGNKILVLCDQEEGGCDEFFVAEIDIKEYHKQIFKITKHK